MIIVLKPNTSDKDIARVEHQIKRNGLDTHIVRGQEMNRDMRFIFGKMCH